MAEQREYPAVRRWRRSQDYVEGPEAPFRKSGPPSGWGVARHRVPDAVHVFRHCERSEANPLPPSTGLFRRLTLLKETN